jgi:hypothetical protein
MKLASLDDDAFEARSAAAKKQAIASVDRPTEAERKAALKAKREEVAFEPSNIRRWNPTG